MDLRQNAGIDLVGLGLDDNVIRPSQTAAEPFQSEQVMIRDGAAQRVISKVPQYPEWPRAP